MKMDKLSFVGGNVFMPHAQYYNINKHETNYNCRTQVYKEPD